MKKSITAIIMATVMFTLAACGTTAPAPAPAAPATPAPAAEAPADEPREVVTIDFWHAMTGPHQEGIQELIERFHDSQPYVRVNEVFQGGYNDLRNQLMANAITETMPHLAQATVADVSYYRLEEMILPLNDFLNDPQIGMSQAEVNDIISIFRETSFFDGELYSVPFSKSTRVLFYNRDLLNEHNLDVPQTWDDILAAAQVLTDPAAGRTGFGFENAFDMEWTALLYQFGGRYIDEASNEAVFASPEGFAALQFIVDLVNSPYGRTAGADGFLSGVFGRGDVAMYIGSSAGLPHVTNAVADTFDWGTAPTPATGTSQAVQFAGNDVVMFSLNRSHTEAERRGAWEFLRFTMEPEQSALWAAASGYIPVRYEAVALPLWQEHLQANPRHAAAPAQFDYGFFLTRVPQASTVRNALLPELENAVLEIASVEDALTRAQERANEILAGRN